MNDDKVLQRVEQLLYEEGELMVSAQKLYFLLKEELEDETIEFENFLLLLHENPNLFKIVDIPFQNNEIQSLADEIFEHGTFGGPFVSVAHKEFTEDEYADFMKLYVDSMIMSLENMYQVKLEAQGPNGEAIQRIEVLLARAYDLKHKLDEIKLQ